MKGSTRGAVRIFGRMPFSTAAQEVLNDMEPGVPTQVYVFTQLVQNLRGIQTDGGAVVTWLTLRIRKDELVAEYSSKGVLIAVIKPAK